jgi:ribosomal protein L14E/L6E/L27E
MLGQNIQEGQQYVVVEGRHKGDEVIVTNKIEKEFGRVFVDAKLISRVGQPEHRFRASDLEPVSPG